MTIGYDSPEIKSDHESELAAIAEAKSAMGNFISTLSKPDFQLVQDNDSVYPMVDPDNPDNIKLVNDLRTIRRFLAGSYLSNYPVLENKAGILNEKSDVDYCFDSLVSIVYEIEYAKDLRQSDRNAPGEGDINTAIDMSIPGVKLGDASLRLKISNDADGNVLSFVIVRPDRAQINNPQVLSDEPIDLSPFEQRLQLIQN